jgi:hypothetical protein
MELIQSGNLLVRLLLEVCALGALGYWGYHATSNRVINIGFAIGVPLIAAVAWAMLASPNAPADLSGGLKLLVQIIVFGAAALALVATRHLRLATLFTVIAVMNAVLLVVWDQ